MPGETTKGKREKKPKKGSVADVANAMECVHHRSIEIACAECEELTPGQRRLTTGAIVGVGEADTPAGTIPNTAMGHAMMAAAMDLTGLSAVDAAKKVLGVETLESDLAALLTELGDRAALSRSDDGRVVLALRIDVDQEPSGAVLAKVAQESANITRHPVVVELCDEAGTVLKSIECQPQDGQPGDQTAIQQAAEILKTDAIASELAQPGASFEVLDGGRKVVVGPNYAEAFHSIAKMEEDIGSATLRWDKKKEEAANAKKEVDRATERLREFIRAIAEKEHQMPLFAAASTHDVAGCAYERDTGQPCPVCSKVREQARVASGIPQGDAERQEIIKDLQRIIGRDDLVDQPAVMAAQEGTIAACRVFIGAARAAADAAKQDAESAGREWDGEYTRPEPSVDVETLLLATCDICENLITAPTPDDRRAYYETEFSQRPVVCVSCLAKPADTADETSETVVH
jgi:hypothetical protein